ncbi:MAG: 4Fe-4S dicluster domain-containing protein [Deltaproteobacteria bacterium]|nr:4Fe-4S dicluster domain-containing protein [Deltaproteobacteria bacterium]
MQRTPYWLIDYGVLIDILAIPVLIIFCYGLYRHWRKILKGEAGLRQSVEKIRSFITKKKVVDVIWLGIIGSRIYNKPVTGISHGMLFWGMLLLFIGTVAVLMNVFFGVPFMSGLFYKWYLSFILDIAGLAALIGLMFLLIRRLFHYKRLYEPEPRKGFVVMELVLLVIIASGFLLEGLRISLSDAREIAVIGHFLSGFMLHIPYGDIVYVILWWFHGLLALGFIAYIPFSPIIHFLFIPVNAAFVENTMGADEKAIDLSSFETEQDDMPAIGTPTLAECTPKRLLDFSACLWCGRCQEVCPATQTGKSLSPKGVILTLARFLHDEHGVNTNLIDSIGMETIFECRTCGACVDVCPAMVNPLKAIWNMRQNLVMERGEMPPQMLQSYKNMEALMHPFSSSANASDWKKGIDVPQFEAGRTEYLLWVGCAVTYEDRAQQIGRAVVRILNNTGISYGIIEEVRCTGDPAKQMGDDYLFLQLAGANIELFRQYGVKKIITICPHCYNSFQRYYPPLGGEYQVTPHVRLIEDLIKSGKLKPSGTNQKITYHDPCYLGRHNGIFDAPRNIIGLIGNMMEMPRNRNNSFCCGAGGGNYWNEEEGERINYARAKEAFETGADKVIACCPFCALMLTDGMKMFTDDKKVFDIAELVEENLLFEEAKS